MVALWLFQRHDVALSEAGVIFFLTSILSAISYLLAVRIAARVGLVNTMVFTHIPANACLVAIPFVDSLAVVVVLLLVRGLLSQMDVPTRSSYVMAIVLPEERPAAASITTVPRSLASSAGPLLAGYLLTASGFGWPLVAAGALKIAYDLMLLATFRKVRPPEEASAKGARAA
jgi:MFS family permease